MVICSTFYLFSMFIAIMHQNEHSVLPGLGKIESWGRCPVHCFPLWYRYPRQTVLQGASWAAVPFWDSCSPAGSAGPARPAGQDGRPSVTLLFASSQKLILPAVSVWLPSQNFSEVWININRVENTGPIDTENRFFLFLPSITTEAHL